MTPLISSSAVASSSRVNRLGSVSPVLEIGNFRVTSVRAGSYWWDGGTFFGVVPKTLWAKTQPPDEQNLIEAGFNCFVVENDEHRILIETGGGVRHDERAKARMRTPDPVRIREAISAHGFEPETIDTVINTHLHWDHVGGNTVDEGGRVVASMPNARYIAQRGELDHARERHPRDSVSYREVNYEPLLEAGQMQLIDGDCEVLPGLQLTVTPGHNRSMMVVTLKSGQDTWCHFADLVQFAVNVTPTWVSGFDLYPLEAIDNKTRLLTQAAAEGWWCSFGHEPVTSFAQVESKDGKWRTINNRT
jgi:glyoxylase-like metal-dependent hydrolase (beta-lactamase superfamily II)